MNEVHMLVLYPIRRSWFFGITLGVTFRLLSWRESRVPGSSSTILQHQILGCLQIQAQLSFDLSFRLVSQLFSRNEPPRYSHINNLRYE